MTAIADRRENGIRTRHRPTVPTAPFIPDLERGVAGGVATLDEMAALVPAAQLGTGTAAAGKALLGDRTWGDVSTQAELDAEIAARAADVDAEETSRIAADAAHVAAADPHTQYQRESERNAANGYPGLDASSKLTGSQQVYGSAANTACQGNDSRLSDARTPTAHETSHVAGGTDPLIEKGTWTPVDFSGAGLAFTGVLGTYEKDLLTGWVVARAILTYPATASGLAAAIDGLPYTLKNSSDSEQGNISFCTATTARYALPNKNTKQLYLYDGAGGSITNAVMSGANIRFEVRYPT